jgi:putative two-component system response regulator
MLRTAGYGNIHCTRSPLDAVASYLRQPADILLLDLNMPGMSGFEVLAALRQAFPHDYLPVIVLTALQEKPTRLRALREGAKDFLTKPFDLVEAASRIRNILEASLLHKRQRDQNRVLEHLVRQRTRELHDTRLEIIRRLGRAAEYRDNETGLHIVRMSHYSAIVGRAAGMNEHETDLLLNASPMHDIGKIGIPDRILLKPGKLDAEEWEIMKTHAAIGARILSGHHSELMELAQAIALSHHEKWDGSGYPHGLRGEEIPLEARVVALADVFDALTSERPYKPAWPLEKALGEIRSLSGIHFDPHLVNLYSEVLPDILAIREQYREPAAA